VIVVEPTLNAEVAVVALPLLRVTVAKRVEPAVKVTVPCGVMVFDFTLAVNVTSWPTWNGFTDDLIVVVVGVTFTT
jgi:hypothetical protein